MALMVNNNSFLLPPIHQLEAERIIKEMTI